MNNLLQTRPITLHELEVWKEEALKAYKPTAGERVCTATRNSLMNEVERTAENPHRKVANWAEPAVTTGRKMALG